MNGWVESPTNPSFHPSRHSSTHHPPHGMRLYLGEAFLGAIFCLVDSSSFLPLQQAVLSHLKSTLQVLQSLLHHSFHLLHDKNNQPYPRVFLKGAKNIFPYSNLFIADSHSTSFINLRPKP